MSLLGRLSIVGASPPPPGTPLEQLLLRSRGERTFPVVCRNLGIPCDLEPASSPASSSPSTRPARSGSGSRSCPKGLHLAHRLYPSPGLRDMGDLDLLVRRERLREADGALRGLGYLPAFLPERIQGGSLQAVEYWREGSMPVHLHWHVQNASWPQFMYRVDVDEIWAEAREGRSLPTS